MTPGQPVALAQERWPAAFAVSLVLHAGVWLVLPHLSRPAKPAPIRVEIEVSQALPPREMPPPAPPPKPEPPKPTPRPVMPKAAPQPMQQALPVLTAREDTPTLPQDPVVAENPPVPPAPAPVTPSAPVSAPSETRTTSAAVSSSANTHSQETDPTEAWEGYGQMLYDMVSKNKTYPQIAIRRHWEGRARVAARFESGKLVELTLVDAGSGHQALDNAALEMLKKAVNALPIRGDLARKAFTVVVPVDFRIEG